MSIFISKGNRKVKACIFNLPCKTTCKQGLACHKFCYAQKAENLYPQVKPCRTNNLKESKQDTFVADMIAKIKKNKAKYFRFMESGDFYSLKFIGKVYRICNSLPEVKFYAYTKRNDLFTARVLKNKPKNLILTYSVDDLQTGKGKYKVPAGYDKVAIVHKTESNCPAQSNDDVKCMRDCFKCANNNKETIIFKKH